MTNRKMTKCNKCYKMWVNPSTFVVLMHQLRIHFDGSGNINAKSC